MRASNRSGRSINRGGLRSLAARASARVLDLATVLFILSLLFQTVHVSIASGQSRRDTDWCSEDWGNDLESACEIRVVTLGARPELVVDAGLNGGIEVTGWSGEGIEIKARVKTWAEDESEAEAMLKEIRVITDGNAIHAEGPDMEDGRRKHRNHWAVSYRIRVPRNTSLDLKAFNGGLSVADVKGTMRLETLNGGLSLDEVAGDVRGETTNGGLSVILKGRSWDGPGLDARTTNGGISLAIPEGYSAELETGTTNGGLDVDLPVRTRGRHSKTIRLTLGDGGPLVSVMTTNGGVSVRRID